MTLRLTEDQWADLQQQSTGKPSSPRVSRAKSLSNPSAVLQRQLQLSRVTAITEYRFHPTRRWRFDLAIEDGRVAVEVEGGLFKRGGGGRHNRGAGMREDIIKYNEALILGWRVVRILPEWVKTGQARDYILRALDIHV